MVFKHIIITRFNLSQRWINDKSGKEVLNERWLEDRYSLFEKYCLPSVKSQTKQDFEWWVYFDSNTNEEFRKKNSNYNLIYPNFKPKYENSYDSFEINMPKEIDRYLKDKNIKWLITTRLDNDDILAVDTIDLIQKGFRTENMHLLEIPIGFTLELRKKIRLRKVNRLGNPFISLAENCTTLNTIKGVFHNQHGHWKNIPRKIVSGQPQWIQIIHENNLINEAKGDDVLHFGISKRFKFDMDNLVFQNVFEFSGRKIKAKSNSFYFNVKRKLKSILVIN